MKIAILSDVHANLEALTAVLRELERTGAERVISLGDAVGYHANPNECVEMLLRAGALTIAGNHDRAAACVRETTDFGSVARKAIFWTRSVLLPEYAERLRELDVFTQIDRSTCAVHAALHPAPNDTYHLTTPARVAASLAMLRTAVVPARICFFGHTHVARIHRSDRTELGELVVPPSPERVTLDDGYFLVNPGSVGQPRDGDPRASFAVFDDRAFSVEFFRVSYDRERALRKAEALGLLADRRSRWERFRSRLSGT